MLRKSAQGERAVLKSGFSELFKIRKKSELYHIAIGSSRLLVLAIPYVPASGLHDILL
jgi:hypothetical protein